MRKPVWTEKRTNWDDEAEVMTRGEVAKFCRVSEQTVSRWTSQGLLKSMTLGGKSYILKCNLKKFLGAE